MIGSYPLLPWVGYHTLLFHCSVPTLAAVSYLVHLISVWFATDTFLLAQLNVWAKINEDSNEIIEHKRLDGRNHV